MATISVAPNPTPVSTTVTATGSGFNNKDTRLRLDGAVVAATFQPSGAGSFVKTFAVSSITTTQVLVAEQRNGSGAAPWKEVARATVVVQSGATLTISNIAEGALTQTSVVISWSTGVPSTGYVKYGPTTGYGSETIHETSFNYSSHAQTISGLTANTAYHYKIVAGSQSGETVESSDGTFTTLASAPTATAPGAPTSLAAVSSDSTVALTWVAPASNGGSAITGYRVYRNGALAATLGAVLSWQDSGRINGTSYSYQVSAVNAVGEGAKSATVVAIPSARPFPAPVTTGTYTVPGNITTSAALNTWVATVPDGSIIEFPAGNAYAMTAGMLFEQRNNLIVRGNGAIFNVSGSGDNEALSVFLMRGANHIAIENFVVHGGYAGVPALQGENAQLLSLSDWYAKGISTYIEMSRVTADHIFGDFVYANGYTAPGGTSAQPSHHLWVHHNSGDHCGRNAISPINCTDAWIENNSWDHVNYHVYDIEPDFNVQPVRRWTFRNETVGSYAHRSGLVGYFLRDWNPQGNAPVSDIAVDRVTVRGNPANGYNGKPVGLSTQFDSPSSNVTMTNCSTTQAMAGPALIFRNVTGLTVKLNTQPLTSGGLTYFENCTGVVTT